MSTEICPLEERKGNGNGAPIPWGEVVRYLKSAALMPHRRSDLLFRALQELLTCLPAVGTALIWPCQEKEVPWEVYYAGLRPESMRRWLSDRLDPSLDVTIGALQQDLIRLAEMPPSYLMCLQPSPGLGAGLWVVWATYSPLSTVAIDSLERIHRTLEAVLEVEGSEAHYFSPSSPLYDRAVVEALAQGDSHALSAFLSLTRLAGKADFTFWGRVYQDVIEVNTHLGARRNEFGFSLPRGRGAGGRIAAYGTPIVLVEDYRNSSYRDPSVSDIVDSEQIRSGIALPVRYSVGSNAEVAAILYATRRTPTPFTLPERLLVQRLARLLEPLPLARRSSSFLSPGLPQPSEQKAAWYDLVLHANRIEVLEAWAVQCIQGPVIVTDSEGTPYVATDAEQLEHLRAGVGSPTDAVQVLSLSAPGVSLPGQIYLRSAIPLPPPEWPSFFTDLVMVSNLVIGRVEKAYDQLTRQREHWIRALLQEKLLQQLTHDGYRLGLPIEQGQLWVVAWSAQAISAAPSTRKRMLAESIVLDHLKCPLLFYGDDIGVIFLDKHVQQQPSKLRDALLRQCAPHPLWIVHGARYHSLHELKMTLAHAITLVQKARRETRSEYLLDMQTPGLESLLENPRLAEDLRDFATRLFTPLLEHDAVKGTRLTETFVLVQTLGSVQIVADQLTVHVNTIRYRLHKVEEILGIEHASPKERTAWALAAFLWERFHLTE